MVSDAIKHYPVLLKEIISIITPQHGGTFIDCTFGQGGYSKEILSYKNTKIIALDRDIESKKKAEKLINKFKERLVFRNKKFSQLNNLNLKDENIKGIIFDLGFSYSQIKDPKKGLSFNSIGELNMQMGMNEFSAKDVVNKLESVELEKIEKTKRKKKFKTHSATKIFQALRIFVNKEVSELIYGLIAASKILKKDGILLVVTFHSLEDKIVKYFFKSLSENKSVSRYVPKIDQPDTLFKILKKKPIIPSSEELRKNIPSRSAKLRYIIKKNNSYNFESDILEKFKNLLEVENFGNKLWKNFLL